MIGNVIRIKPLNLAKSTSPGQNIAKTYIAIT